MTKYFIVAAIFISTSSCKTTNSESASVEAAAGSGGQHGKVLNCRENAAWLNKNGKSDWSGKKITLEIVNANQLTLKVGDKKYNATRDTSFGGPDARFVYGGGSADTGENGMFVNQSVLKGQFGKVTISTNQYNDGDGGEKILWYTDEILDCGV